MHWDACRKIEIFLRVAPVVSLTQSVIQIVSAIGHGIPKVARDRDHAKREHAQKEQR